MDGLVAQCEYEEGEQMEQVVDVQEKSDSFDELAAKFEVPPLATAAA